jgi:hypothetical protein
MENPFLGCSGGIPVREGKITRQETGRGAKDSMELKVIIPRAEDWAGISSKDFAERQAKTYRKLILKLTSV